MSRNGMLRMARTYHNGLASFYWKPVRGLCYSLDMDDDQIIDPATAQALQKDVAQTRSLFGWAVWRDAPDYSGKVIARLVTDKPTPYVLVADTLAELQAMLPRRLERSDRRTCDAPELVEVWLGP
jgi:hypothetical protein